MKKDLAANERESDKSRAFYSLKRFAFFAWIRGQSGFGLRVISGNAAIGIPRYTRNVIIPPTTVAITCPCICRPSNGEFFDLE